MAWSIWLLFLLFLCPIITSGKLHQLYLVKGKFSLYESLWHQYQLLFSIGRGINEFVEHICSIHMSPFTPVFFRSWFMPCWLSGGWIRQHFCEAIEEATDAKFLSLPHGFPGMCNKWIIFCLIFSLLWYKLDGWLYSHQLYTLHCFNCYSKILKLYVTEKTLFSSSLNKAYWEFSDLLGYTSYH